MSKKVHIISMAILIVAVAGGAFLGGTAWQKSQNPSRNSQFGGQFNRTGTRQGAGVGPNFINGDVVSKDDKSITVKDRQGNSRIIFYSGTTEVGKFVTGSVSDVAVGQNVMVNGKATSDGSITAQSIQIRPASPAGQPGATPPQGQ